MGIYIKGMKMPIYGCKDCIFVNRKWCGDICPFLKREVTGNVERGGFQTDCPLAPVPPHGRLIDADKFYADINESVLLTDGFKELFNLWFDEQKTIIPAEECE